MKDFSDKVAAITGAASGIGRELAVCLAEAGCSVALADIDARGLAETKEIILDRCPAVTTHRVDVSKLDQVCRFADEILTAHGHVDLLINNAAVVIVETLEDVTYADFEWLMGVNFWGVVYGTKVLLPHLKKRPEAHIVNISSIAGVMTSPNNGPYSAAKFAVIGFTETLGQELQGTHVGVSCVVPGGIKTNIHRNALFCKQANPTWSRDDSVRWFEEASMTSSRNAARTILKGIKKKRNRILIGVDAHLIDCMKRMFPVQASSFVARKMKCLDAGKDQIMLKLLGRLLSSEKSAESTG
jgi:NAD(P)-dependent dehydrogenase (short-subunit alcohol dehydrogenase family)